MFHLAIKTILFTLSEINAYKRLQCKHCTRDAEQIFYSIGFQASAGFGITNKRYSINTANFFFIELVLIAISEFFRVSLRIWTKLLYESL